MQLEDWLDDLCVRFIVNLPPEELESVERICFQVEEAQWFYEDFIRPLDPSLPSLPLRAFSLRIFQHCPLFSQWSAEHYTTAFAEFMAYKSRVPVRGAILLSDSMDECVLVKGWKKGANWSFPRGKINKDEKDLDCAVREVYEETGLDLRAAGLVQDEKDMKFIEQTMREQHMKLFVFRGVPKSTYFEPRTRKEISKIEWYKLTDLPTLKKHKHQESNGGGHASMNANKFYMVAPFLGQLKKWIAQEKKKESRHSSHLAAPPMLAEESDIETGPETLQQGQDLQFASDLPEVTISRSNEATAQLKQLFNIGIPEPSQAQPQPIPPSHMPQVDASKSRSLLALLRGDPSTELQAGPLTPLEQVSFAPEMPQSPHHSHVRQTPLNQQFPPPFHIQSELPSSPAPRRHVPELVWQNPQQEPFRGQIPPEYAPARAHGAFFDPPVPPPKAPYQQTGDPDFARTRQIGHPAPAVPPASALPKLTTHTKSLLDVFTSAAPLPRGTATQQPGPAKQSLLDLFTQSGPASKTGVSVLNTQAPQISPLSSKGPESATLISTPSVAPRPGDAHPKSLLDLLSQPGPRSAVPSKQSIKLAAELPTTPEHRGQGVDDRQDVLEKLFKQDKMERPLHKKQAPLVKEGETAATISGPLNQPNFEAVTRSHKEDKNGMGRSPLTSHRTLFDPNQPTPVKIMTRPETPKQTQGKSPRASKAKMATSSPKRSAKSAPKEPAKPFQPQILRRPQTGDAEANATPANHVTTSTAATAGPTSMSRDVSSEKEKGPVERKLSQADAHKQSLLSLFGGGSPSSIKGGQTPSRVVSPLSVSQLVSPRDEVPVSAVEPISTRSRVGSIASVGSGPAAMRPGLEKRQTGAENRAFLLGYLGRMATQEG